MEAEAVGSFSADYNVPIHDGNDGIDNTKKEDLKRVDNIFKRALNCLKDYWKPTLTMTALAALVTVAVLTSHIELIIGLTLTTLFFGSWSLYDKFVYDRKINEIKKTSNIVIETYSNLIQDVKRIENVLKDLERDTALDKSTCLEDDLLKKLVDGIILGYTELASSFEKALQVPEVQRYKLGSAFRRLNNKKKHLEIEKESFGKTEITFVSVNEEMKNIRKKITKCRDVIQESIESQQQYLKKSVPSKKQ